MENRCQFEQLSLLASTVCVSMHEEEDLCWSRPQRQSCTSYSAGTFIHGPLSFMLEAKRPACFYRAHNVFRVVDHHHQQVAHPKL